MFDTYLDHWLQYGRARFYSVTLGGGVLLCLLSGWLWWHFSYLNPQTVFWAAVNNNLIINGVTKHTVSQESGGTLDQYDQIGLGAHNVVRSVSVIAQSGQAPGSTVVTETVGTPDANFARYTKINTNQKTPTGQPLDFSQVVGKWSKQDLGGNANGAFADAVFDAVPFGHLNASQRQQVVAAIHRDNTYTIDFGAVAKERKNGRLYYTYDASLAPDKYVSLLKQVDSLMGLNQLKNLDPSQYQGGNAIQLKITVDAAAHQLAQVTYVANNRQESYASWGVAPNPVLPQAAVTSADLQAKLNSILNGQ